MLATSRYILEKANKEKYAVGAFNINNLEFLKAVIAAATKLKSPVIIATSEGAIKYVGVEYLKAMVHTAAHLSDIPVCLHLDHGRDLNIIRKCIHFGYTSVMIDASHYDFDKNVEITRKVVEMVHGKGISVEAELGTIGGAEENVKSRRIIYTDPNAAERFVRETGIDSLAVAIGTSHGAYKFAGEAKLNF
ncbi:MAG: class II fructose-bisphosphate aldolase family protein, partial [Candidatus Woesearchaeota archaeon]|nr:class II fructose-bisphosphate aldolase family protein [Candidatus Woesearchaeota archaeon]